MFGNFLNNHIRLDYSDLRYKEQGTPIVAQRNNRMFQFGIYGDNSVIFQRCIKMGSIILFSIEKCSAKDFCSGACLYEYTPQFEFDKSIAYANAVHYYTAGRGNAIPASINLSAWLGTNHLRMLFIDLRWGNIIYIHSIWQGWLRLSTICLLLKRDTLSIFHEAMGAEHPRLFLRSLSKWKNVRLKDGEPTFYKWNTSMRIRRIGW